MPDVDPSQLQQRPSISTTPILPPKTLNTSAQAVPKAPKSYNVPPRIDLEPLYTALKSAIGEQWATYKESISLFVMGQLNQAELSGRIDPILVTPGGALERLHNQLISGIFGNITRDLPDVGIASWVSANDKPTTGAGSKPVSGDAAEQRLKTEVMQLPSRDRRRLKDLAQNDFDPQDPFATVWGERRRVAKPKTAEPTPGGIGPLINVELESYKRYIQPLASESGEFPDTSVILSRMAPICFETDLNNGPNALGEAAQFMAVATETFIKEVLSSIFSKTRSNGPGTSGTAGTGGGTSWIQTHKYRTQLEREEEAALRGEVHRDKSGLLPIEARAAGERPPLGMADVQTALEISDCGLGQMPVLVRQIMSGFREGEVEAWEQYSWPESHVRIVGEDADGDTEMGGVNGMNGHIYKRDSISEDAAAWEGWEGANKSSLDSLLDTCLAI